MNIKDSILDKIKNTGDTFKDELILLRKIIMNKKLVVKYKERIDLLTRNNFGKYNKEKQTNQSVYDTENVKNNGD